MEAPSADLMARWRDGDQEAANQLFRRYAERLLALARAGCPPGWSASSIPRTWSSRPAAVSSSAPATAATPCGAAATCGGCWRPSLCISCTTRSSGTRRGNAPPARSAARGRKAASSDRPEKGPARADAGGGGGPGRHPGTPVARPGPAGTPHGRAAVRGVQPRRHRRRGVPLRTHRAPPPGARQGAAAARMPGCSGPVKPERRAMPKKHRAKAPTSSGTEDFDRLLDRFDQAWQSEPPPAIDEFLPAGSAGRRRCSTN